MISCGYDRRDERVAREALGVLDCVGLLSMSCDQEHSAATSGTERATGTSSTLPSVDRDCVRQLNRPRASAP
jgi:hypothetical protein